MTPTTQRETPMLETVTASAAARLCNVGRSTILRRLAASQIPGAKQALDGVWQIPLRGLRAAGFDPKTELGLTPTLAQLQAKLVVERTRREAAEALADERAAHIRDLHRLLQGTGTPTSREALQARVVAYIRAHGTADHPLAVATIATAFPHEDRQGVRRALHRAASSGHIIRVDRGLYAPAR